ncbi:MAG: DUF3618 domain-containing protein [Chloroflexota bacterium]|nr:DUF3618 domain-containing protein [Chloroflexota bacterium]
MGERADPVSERREYDDIRVSGAFGSLPGERVEGAEAGSGYAADQDEPEALVTDIEHTRADLSETIEAIQERLAPERITDQAIDAATEATEQAREAALEVVDHAIEEAKAAIRELTDQARGAVREATVGRVERMASKTGQQAQGLRSSVITTIKQNPGPAALTGLGISWLFLSGRSAGGQGQSRQFTGYQTTGPAGYGGYGYGGQQGSQSGTSTVGQVAGQVQDTVGGAVSQAQETVGDAAAQARETAGQVADQAQAAAGQVAGQVQGAAGQVTHQVQGAATQVTSQVQTLGSRVRQAVEQNPLPAGALAVVLGGVAGLAAPKTAREDQVLGGARDAVVANAESTAQGVVQKVQRVAEEAEEAAEKEARYQGLTPGS